MPGAGLAAAGVAAALVALVHLRRAAVLLFDRRLMHRDSFRLATMTAGRLQRIAINATPFLLPLLFQLGLGLAVTETGFLILVYFLGNLTAKTITTRLLRLTGFHTLAVTNGIGFGLSVAIFAAVPVTAPDVLLWLLLFLAGAVRSVQFTTLNTFAYAEIEASERATSATLAAMTQQVAMLLGVAVPVAILRVAGAVTGSETSLSELRLCLVVMGIVCALAALWFLRLAPGTSADVSGHGPHRRAGLPG